MPQGDKCLIFKRHSSLFITIHHESPGIHHSRSHHHSSSYFRGIHYRGIHYISGVFITSVAHLKRNNDILKRATDSMATAMTRSSNTSTKNYNLSYADKLDQQPATRHDRNHPRRRRDGATRTLTCTNRLKCWIHSQRSSKEIPSKGHHPRKCHCKLLVLQLGILCMLVVLKALRIRMKLAAINNSSCRKLTAR